MLLAARQTMLDRSAGKKNIKSMWLLVKLILFFTRKKLCISLEMLNWWMAFCNLNPHLLLFYAAAVAQEMRGETQSVGWRTSSSSSRYLGAEFRFWWGGRMDRALILGLHKTCRHFQALSFFYVTLSNNITLYFCFKV